MKLLKVLSVEQLRVALSDYLQVTQESLELALENGLNYYLAADVFAGENGPMFKKSTVDGYALNSRDAQGASTNIPALLKYQGSCPIGETNELLLQAKQCQYLNTGAMLPTGADAVAMIENTEYIVESKDVLIDKNLSVFENVTLPGDDIKEGELLFKKGHYLDERALATLASQGITSVNVWRKPTCIIVSSGNELVEYSNKPELAQVRDINTILIKNELIKQGFDVKATFLLKDDYQSYYQTLEQYDVDLYITSGGSSQGDEDYTYDVFKELTNNVICHGLAIKPGKPTIAALKDHKFYLGLPGNPVSAYLVLKQTLIQAYQECYQQAFHHQISVRLEHNIQGSPGKERIILVTLNKDGDRYSALPIYYRSSNVLNLAQADGYFIIGANVEGKNKDDLVEVRIL